VRVGIDEAGRQGQAGGVDFAIGGTLMASWRHLGDASLADHHVRLERLAAAAVQHRRVSDNEIAHRLFLLRQSP
jgi:hypothetical protein